MKQNYFVYNNIKYPTGTGIKIKQWYTNEYDDAFFVYYDTEKCLYVYRVDYKDYILSEQRFWEYFGGTTAKFNTNLKSPETKQLKDWQINGLFIGWVWYVFIMAISLIFKGALGIWIFATVIFFRWRKAKIQKEGYYVEW